MVRINKYLAQAGICSRREADRFVAGGQVKINGKVAKPGDQVAEGDEVRVFGKPVRQAPKKMYIALNKPVGYITTTDKKSKDNVFDLLKDIKERLFPIGRLDVESSGLLLFTNDGALANQLMHPRYEHEKEYEVHVRKTLTDQQLEKLANGIKLEDGITLPAKVRRIDEKRFSIILKEGRNRQIRRMCEEIGQPINTLKRVRIKHVRLDEIKLGTWRHLTEEEIAGLVD